MPTVSVSLAREAGRTRSSKLEYYQLSCSRLSSVLEVERKAIRRVYLCLLTQTLSVGSVLIHECTVLLCPVLPARVNMARKPNCPTANSPRQGRHARAGVRFINILKTLRAVVCVSRFLFVSVYARLTQQAPAAVRTVRNIRTRCTARALAPDSDERHVARGDTWVKEGQQLRVVSRLLQIVSDCQIEGGMNRCMKGRMAWGWHGDGIGWGGGGMQLAPYVLPPA